MITGCKNLLATAVLLRFAIIIHGNELFEGERVDLVDRVLDFVLRQRDLLVVLLEVI